MNLILIGMPASGKSTIGVVLSKTLGMSFLDTDILIQEREGKLLQEIIDEQGMEHFLKVEENVLSKIDPENTIVSTGGSAVYSKKAMQNLKCLGTIIYLDASIDEIKRRLSDITTRGIAMGPGESLEDLYNRRKPLYEKYADIQIDVDNKSIEDVVRDITMLRKS